MLRRFFLLGDHQLIYAAILAVYERHNRVDALLVSDELERKNELNRSGGDLYLYDLQAQIVETESAEFYAQIVWEKSTRRQLAQAGEQISNLARDQEQELREVLDQAQEGIFHLGQADNDKGFVSVGSIVKETLGEIEELSHKREQFIGIPTGLYRFRPNDVWITAWRFNYHCGATQHGQKYVSAEYGSEYCH